MKEDRRVQRTKQLLRDALVELILENGYDKVKVSHITDRANLARATFYLHYKDKDELLTNSLYDVFDELIKQLGDINTQSLLTFDPKYRKLPFDHVQQYRDLYRVALMSTDGVSSITNNARLYMSRHMMRHLQHMIPADQDRVPLPIVANYMAGALMSLISWWIEDGEQYDSAYMAQMFYWLSMPTLSMILGASTPPPSPDV